MKAAQEDWQGVARYVVSAFRADAARADADADARITQLEPVISPIPRCPTPPGFDRDAHRARNLVEQTLCRLKDWRAIATRDDKTARKYVAGNCVTVVVIDWLQ